jgi:hypothetical protein
LEGELCISDNLEDSRGADEESELGSIPTNPTPGRRHCQSQATLKSRLIILTKDRFSPPHSTRAFSRLGEDDREGNHLNLINLISGRSSRGGH